MDESAVVGLLRRCRDAMHRVSTIHGAPRFHNNNGYGMQCSGNTKIALVTN
jgi:hypothetical protein